MDRLDSPRGAQPIAIAPSASTLAANKVLKNTYLLLSATLAFSAITAAAAMALNLPHPGLIITMVGYFGLLFAVNKTADRALGILFVFALTGFMGYTLGPIISAYLRFLPSGHDVVVNAFGITALTFVGLSAYAIRSGRDFSFLGGFLFAGILAAFLLGLAAVFLHVPALSLAVSAMFVMLMAGLILWQTGQIVNGGETNYILATVTLYVSLFNLFTSLLQLLGFASED